MNIIRKFAYLHLLLHACASLVHPQKKMECILLYLKKNENHYSSHRYLHVETGNISLIIVISNSGPPSVCEGHG